MILMAFFLLLSWTEPTHAQMVVPPIGQTQQQREQWLQSRNKQLQQREQEHLKNIQRAIRPAKPH